MASDSPYHYTVLGNFWQCWSTYILYYHLGGRLKSWSLTILSPPYLTFVFCYFYSGKFCNFYCSFFHFVCFFLFLQMKKLIWTIKTKSKQRQRESNPRKPVIDLFCLLFESHRNSNLKSSNQNQPFFLIGFWKKKNLDQIPHHSPAITFQLWFWTFKSWINSGCSSKCGQEFRI